jgi:hypothetical protein
MSTKTQVAYAKALNLIGDEGTKLSPGEYEDFLNELAAHVQCLLDCIKEEKEE